MREAHYMEHENLEKIFTHYHIKRHFFFKKIDEGMHVRSNEITIFTFELWLIWQLKLFFLSRTWTHFMRSSGWLHVKFWRIHNILYDLWLLFLNKKRKKKDFMHLVGISTEVWSFVSWRFTLPLCFVCLFVCDLSI